MDEKPDNPEVQKPFRGTKAALVRGDCLIVLCRDDCPTIPYPTMLDFAGGGREGNESAFECIVRETREEFGIDITHCCLVWEEHFPSKKEDLLGITFFVFEITTELFGEITLGDEGQYWLTMTFQDFIDHPKAIPSLKRYLSSYISAIK